jgi:hypothetical protein
MGILLAHDNYKKLSQHVKQEEKPKSNSNCILRKYNYQYSRDQPEKQSWAVAKHIFLGPAVC